MRKLFLLSTAPAALVIGCPSANAEIFRMTCLPTDSIPYTVTYNSDARVSYITGSRTGTTRKYYAFDVKDRPDIHLLYVATKAPNQTRTVYLAFNYWGDGDSGIRVIDGASDKKDRCAFVPDQTVAKATELEAKRQEEIKPAPPPVIIHEPAPQPVIVQAPSPPPQVIVQQVPVLLPAPAASQAQAAQQVPSDDNFDPSGCTFITLGSSYTAHKGPDETSEVVGEVESGDKICALSINTSGWSQIHWRRGKAHDGYIKGLATHSPATPS